MNRNRLILIGCAAVMAAGAISILVYRILNAAVASAYSPNAVAVVAAFDLPVGSVITDRDVKVVRYAGEIPDGAFRHAKDVVGRGVITSVARNEILLPSKLAADKAGGGLPAMIPQGKRAVAVKVNEVIGVAGFALPGTKVDVVVTGNVERGNEPGNVTATTVLQNVQVLAAGQSLQTNNQGKAETVQVITLLVTPEEAQKLALASQEGRIQLTLRNPLDVEATAVRAVKNASIYGVGPAPVVHHVAAKPKVEAAPKPVIYTVETIKGTKRDVTSFPEGSSGDER